jgi:hypothetical protein
MQVSRLSYQCTCPKAKRFIKEQAKLAFMRMLYIFCLVFEVVKRLVAPLLSLPVPRTGESKHMLQFALQPSMAVAHVGIETKKRFTHATRWAYWKAWPKSLHRFSTTSFSRRAAKTISTRSSLPSFVSS